MLTYILLCSVICYVCKKSQPDTCFAAVVALDAASSSMIDGYQVHLDPKQQTGINFTIKSGDEAILIIEDETKGYATRTRNFI